MNNWSILVRNKGVPGACLLCGETVFGGLNLCRPCRDDLPRLGNHCRPCGVPLVNGRLCPACMDRPPPFDRTWAAFPFAPPISDLVHLMKFRGRLDALDTLGSLLVESLGNLLADPPEVIIPVPLHRRRLRERGYNQALELSRPVAEATGARLLAEAVVRVAPTAPQTSMADSEDRRRNIRGAFRLRDSARPPGRVLIVDDVVTTGATVTELAKVLIRAGTGRIEVCCLARACV